MKYSQRFEEDWKFYLNNKEKFTFCGEEIIQWPYDVNGKDSKYCFHKFDSTGKILPSSEPELIREVLRCKKSINWHIKEYADGLTEPYWLGTLNELLNEFKNPPYWVEQAMRKQVCKFWRKKHPHVVSNGR